MHSKGPGPTVGVDDGSLAGGLRQRAEDGAHAVPVLLVRQAQLLRLVLIKIVVDGHVKVKPITAACQFLMSARQNK